MLLCIGIKLYLYNLYFYFWFKSSIKTEKEIIYNWKIKYKFI